jgi:DNA polymerase-3 subunit epsilon
MNLTYATNDKIRFTNKNVNFIDEINLEQTNFDLNLLSLESKIFQKRGLKISNNDLLNCDIQKWFEYVTFLEEQGIKKILFLDFETTMLNGNALSLGMILYNIKTKEEKEFYSLFNPLSKIDPEASKVHGISDSDVKNSPTFMEMINDIEKNFFNQADILVAFNAIYDMSVIVREYERANKILPDIYFLDLMTRSKNIISAKNTKGRLKNPSLSEFALFVGEKYSEKELHNSLYDTKIMFNSFKKLLSL